MRGTRSVTKASLYVKAKANIGVEKHYRQAQDDQSTAIGTPQSTIACEPYCSTEDQHKPDIDSALQGH